MAVQLRAWTGGITASGLRIDVASLPTGRVESAFVLTEKLPTLLTAIDSLLRVRVNPTRFPKWRVYYRADDGLVLSAYYYDFERKVYFTVKTGEVLQAERDLNPKDFAKFREWVASGIAKLGAP